MARISQYNVDSNISDTDKLLGSDTENSNVTKVFTVGDLAAYINGESPGTPGSGTVTSVNAAAGTGISISGAPITTSGTIEITNTAPDTGVPAILSNGSVPTLNSGITAEEIRNLIGAGGGEGSGTVTSVGITPGTGISVSGSPITTSGNITITNTSPNVSTNLSTTTSSTTVTVVSSDGNNATLPAATTSLAGVMTASDKTKLDGLGSAANYVQNSADTFTSTSPITQIVTLTQAEYDDISPINGILYIIL